MGISEIMQPRAAVSTDGCPPASGPEALPNSGVSRGLIPAGDSPVSPYIRKRPFKARPKTITDKKLRKITELILILRTQGKSRKEIAEELELSENTVKTYLYRARKKGYLTTEKFDDPSDTLEHIIKPKVVENINALLDWKHPKTGLPSMEMTLETAKGTGIFQQHSVNKGPVGPTGNANVLKVQIVMPPTNGLPTIEARVGTMGGRQSVTEGEVVMEEDRTNGG